MNAYFAEFFGTALLILLGNGVVANVCLNNVSAQIYLHRIAFLFA